MAYRDDEEYNFTDPPYYAQGPIDAGATAQTPALLAEQNRLYGPQGVYTPQPAPAPSNVHTEWFGGGGPQGQYSRGLEDAFLNFASTYGGPKDAASLAAAFGNGAKATSGDTI